MEPNPNQTIRKPTLLAPAGDWRMLRTAVDNGADAVYLGIDRLNMRARARNFTLDTLPEVVGYCCDHAVDVNLTVNTLVYEHELPVLDDIVCGAKAAGCQTIICWDPSVIEACRRHAMPFTVSTQASVANTAAARFYQTLGARRIVLARECTLEQIEEIKRNTDIEIECFVHGAMCIAISGRCLMSQYAFGENANRGACIQPCRREYRIFDNDDEKNELVLGEDYVLSPKDLCTLEFINRLIDAGIDSFKIEGRKRSPEYVARVTRVYRQAIDMHFAGKPGRKARQALVAQLAEVYHRGFSKGFYFGAPAAEDYARRYGSGATTRKQHIGKVLEYTSAHKVARILMQADTLTEGDRIYIIGDDTGVAEGTVNAIMHEERRIRTAEKGQEIAIPFDKHVQEEDQVYKIIPATPKAG